MQVYFSHSYRDVTINSYFLNHFVTEEIPLLADQKTDVWCVAKLERYLGEVTGFVSIIPRRPTEEDAGAYSPYIGKELELARRARLPRLLFVDEQVLTRHQLDFPRDAVPFSADEPEEGFERHAEAIDSFRKMLEVSTPAASRTGLKEATVFVAERKMLGGAGQDVAEILKRRDYSVNLLVAQRPSRALDDIRLFETLWRSELCVFLLGERLSDAHLALAMARAHCIPSMRLQYARQTKDCTPTLSGVVRWTSEEDMLVEFAHQLKSYEEGLVEPVDLAHATTSEDAIRSISKMRWRARADNYWDERDGPALVYHIHSDHSFVQDEVNRVRRQFGKPLGLARAREDSLQICNLLYDGLKRHRFGYELEPQTGELGRQAIRTPTQVQAHRTATCIDLGCLFGALLEAAGQNPVVVIIEGDGFAHALSGYRALDEPSWQAPSLADLKRAVQIGDVVLFEATGAVEANGPVGRERELDRSEKVLAFIDARAAAERLVNDFGVSLKYLIDIRVLRQQIQGN